MIYSLWGETNFSEWVQSHGKVYHSEKEHWSIDAIVLSTYTVLGTYLHIWKNADKSPVSPLGVALAEVHLWEECAAGWDLSVFPTCGATSIASKNRSAASGEGDAKVWPSCGLWHHGTLRRFGAGGVHFQVDAQTCLRCWQEVLLLGCFVFEIWSCMVVGQDGGFCHFTWFLRIAWGIVPATLEEIGLAMYRDDLNSRITSCSLSEWVTWRLVPDVPLPSFKRWCYHNFILKE